jgi:cyclase
MNQDGVRNGYDLEQLATIKGICKVPLVASGGAGCPQHFRDVFEKTDVSAALAASVFHDNIIDIPGLKRYLYDANVDVRL